MMSHAINQWKLQIKQLLRTSPVTLSWKQNFAGFSNIKNEFVSFSIFKSNFYQPNCS